MTLQTQNIWNGRIGTVTIGADRAHGGTRTLQYTLGGEQDLAAVGPGATQQRPLIAAEICDDPGIWSPIVNTFMGDTVNDTAGWAGTMESEYHPDIVRLHLTSTRKRNFKDFSGIPETVSGVLKSTGLPLIIEGSNDPSIDSEVYQKCGEASSGERVLLGTAEAGRYRSIAAAAMAYNHCIIAQSPIDINLAKQLNILLKEIGVPYDRILIDPYTGALGYGFEYSYSVMERIRYAALKGDQDLAMTMISAAPDSLNIREVREARDDETDRTAATWEFYTAFSAVIAGASIVCVRHPLAIPLLKSAIDSIWPHSAGREA
jgi:CO dehydrogenase/acetyl-CoA synthase delta subunit (corrinoid Fe-S protein)